MSTSPLTWPAPTPVQLRPRRIAPAPGTDGAPAPGTDSPPDNGPLVDRFGRVHADLRISITDRCNFRCTYCMPEDGMPFSPREELLTPAEIERVARVAHRLGVRAVRVTGGEPLLRHDVVEVVERLAKVGFEDLAMTTNGWLLARLAGELRRAGLNRLNVSCDSLRPERFARIRRRGELSRVLAAMDAAEAAGFPPPKVNVVLVAGVNDDEVLDFAAFARRTGRPVRFIELMPLDADGAWSRDQVVAGQVVLDRIGARWPLEPVRSPGDVAPATRYRFADGLGEIGIIATVTEPFCGTCDRLRLTADGAVRNCLFSDDERSLRDLLRSGAGDDVLAGALRSSVGAKRAGHGIDEPGFLRPARTMSRIGG
jgi:cyclic pyranopterin phosphate synthase